MTFPDLSPDQLKIYEGRQAKLAATFLSKPEAQEIFKSDADLEAFAKFQKEFKSASTKEFQGQDPALINLAKALEDDAKDQGLEKKGSSLVGKNPLVKAYTEFSSEKEQIENGKQAARLKNSVAGRLGSALEFVFAPLDFDWKTNIGLVGGFAAKEVVVSTLGTAYGLGEVNAKEAGNLSDRLKEDPLWNPLKAFTLLIFVMLYAPCATTLIVMKKETGTWKWPLFAMVYTTTLAYFVALLVNWLGRFLGWGLTY
jgi:hypothetical protein